MRVTCAISGPEEFEKSFLRLPFDSYTISHPPTSCSNEISRPLYYAALLAISGLKLVRFRVVGLGSR